MKSHPLFATCPKAMEPILAEELHELGAINIKQMLAGVAFEGSLKTAYSVCLWSRIANRVLLVISDFGVLDQEDLYQAVYKINWFEHMKPDDSLAVTFSAKNSKVINNTHFGALKVKDAIVDQMRVKFNKRPNISIHQPDIRINLYLNGDKARLSLDLSGESLHRRGYRDINIAAPIKENLAAAMLYRSNWLEMARNSCTLLDPMCGSGTLIVEGAMMAADYAPGLLRKHYGFLKWKKHDADCWQKLLQNAEQRKAKGLENLPVIVGFDHNRRTVNAALSHIENAGLSGKIHVERRDISDASPAQSWQPGLLICNPPYGERLGTEAEIATLYLQFGEILKARFINWQATLIISNPEMGFRIGIRSQKPLTLYNGALECKLLRMNIAESTSFIPKSTNRQERLQTLLSNDSQQQSIAAEMFANRLKKNIKKLNKWVKRNQINCYRIYDADLPEYAVAIDIYQGEKTWVNVQEYEAPKSVSREKADLRLAGIMAEIPQVLAIPTDQVFLKIRRKQKNTDQYNKLSDTDNFHIVEENGCRLLVNFEDHLDTGLFLDHRPLRALIQQQSQGKHFLNLFAYTGTASVHAAKGGARSTTTVDMSKNYLDWAARNMQLNNLQGDNQFIRADCLEWLETAGQQQHDHLYDIIFLDPPTFSNSKRMQQVFDLQQQHVTLINQAIELLAPGGMLYFSTNFRRFKLNTTALSELIIENISSQTIAKDFSRNPKIHYCWKIRE